MNAGTQKQTPKSTGRTLQ